MAKQLIILLSIIMWSCTAPTVPGAVLGTVYLVDTLMSTNDQKHRCACDNTQLTLIYCKEDNDKNMTVAPIQEATHMCCGSCMKACYAV